MYVFCRQNIFGKGFPTSIGWHSTRDNCFHPTTCKEKKEGGKELTKPTIMLCWWWCASKVKKRLMVEDRVKKRLWPYGETCKGSDGKVLFFFKKKKKERKKENSLYGG